MPSSNSPPVNSQSQVTISKIAAGVAAIVVLSAALATGGFTFAGSRHQTYIALRSETREVRIIQQALSDTHIAVRGMADESPTSGDHQESGPRILSTFAKRIATIDEHLRTVGAEARTRVGIDALVTGWKDVMALVAAKDDQGARDLWEKRGLDEIYSGTRDGLERYWVDRTKVARETIQDDELLKWLVLLFQVFAGCCSLAGIWIILKLTAIQSRERTAARLASDASHTRMKQLFQMTDMLQSAADIDDANAVLRATAGDLLTDLGGALYVFNDARDRLVRSTVFGGAQETEFPDSISPSDCWALKRGKTHINARSRGTLCCEHHRANSPVIEVPMTARSELIGVLHVVAKDEQAFDRLRENNSIISAIADGMSLALSNIVLREQLRGEILRDPLTRLYNRRYLEDTLQRFILLAQREGKKLALIGIQVDDYQQFKADHSQVINNALLREIGAVVHGLLRRSDFAARYEHPQIIVLLPECSLENALTKAELLRGKIHSLSKDFSSEITASIGVTEFSAAVSDMNGLLTAAAQAVARASEAGGNRVVQALPQVTDERGRPIKTDVELVAAE